MNKSNTKKVSYNMDYKKELKPDQKVQFFKDKKCEKCGSRMVALPPDRAWCESDTCNYGVLLIIGKGVYEFELIN